MLDFFERRLAAEDSAKDVSIEQEQQLGDRKRSDTAIVFTINHAEHRSGFVSILALSAPWWSGVGSVVGRLKTYRI